MRREAIEMSVPVKRWGEVVTHQQKKQLIAAVMSAMDKLLSHPSRHDILDNQMIVIREIMTHVDEYRLRLEEGIYLTANGLVIRRRERTGLLNLRSVITTEPLSIEEFEELIEQMEIGVGDVENVAKRLE